MASYCHGPVGVEILFSWVYLWGATGGVAVTLVDMVVWAMNGLGRAYWQMLSPLGERDQDLSKAGYRGARVLL